MQKEIHISLSMAVTSTSSKQRPFLLFILFFISFPLLFISTAFFPNPQLSDVVVHIQTPLSQPQASHDPNKVKQPKWIKVIHDETQPTPHHKPLKLGLVNFHDPELTSDAVAESVTINFEPVSSNITWEKLFPEWVDEAVPEGSCPEIPMPEPGKYSGLDAVVAKMPCMEVNEEIDMNGNHWKEGIRDVQRLQISLATAHVIVENGINKENKDVYGVFIGKCEPMVELFRCEDLVWHGGEYWVYKPNLEKLKEMIRMPVGSCALPHRYAAGNSG